MPDNQVSPMPFYPFLRAVELQGSSGAGAQSWCAGLSLAPGSSCDVLLLRAVRVVGDLFLVNGGGLLWGQAPSRGSESVLSR